MMDFGTLFRSYHMAKYERTTPEGDTEFSDGQDWFSDHNLCHHCEEQRRAAGLPFRWADEQYSFGVYAGRY